MARALIVGLKGPARIFLGEEPSAPLRIDGVPVVDRFPFWSTAPDLLTASRPRVLVGVSYPIPAEHRGDVEAIVSLWDPCVVRYDDGHLDILWSTLEPQDRIPAQVSEDIWYCLDSARGGRTESVVAFGLSDPDGILRAFGLTMPSSFPHPLLAVAGAGPFG
jgi:hypothetical protein